MNYSVNPQAAFGLNFSVPVSVTDKYLKPAGSAQLKVLLLLLRHGGEVMTTQELSSQSGIPAADVNDAMQYWLDNSIVIADGVTDEKESRKEEIKAPVSASEKEKVLPILPESKPSAEVIAQRSEESPEIQFMFLELQTKLGRTIGYETQADFLMMHDRYGLPVEVILMLVDYCVSVNKSSLGYMTRMAKSWGEKEIDSLDKADEIIRSLRNTSETWARLKELTGITNPSPTARQKEYLIDWTERMGFSVEMIYLAYEEMANHTEKLSFPYMNRVLQNWYAEGLDTVEKVKAASERRAENKPSGKSKKGSKPEGYDSSYDLDDFMQHSMNDTIEYKKSGKGAG